ncbi:Polycystic kidney disease and receptor for egg jelly-related protein, partial [Lamellibrachia satsuma]
MINQAGTTATISMRMTGDKRTGAKHVLEDANVHLFQIGSEDWFIVAEKHSLGSLTELVIWVDYSKAPPSWFLNQINVRDTRTGKTYHFVCNKWLIPDEDGDVVTYNLTSVKVHSYMYTFRVKSLQNLRDQHLWVSIFVCPRHTTFSRVQRLSCAFAFIMSSMLVNLMFYGVNVSIVHEDLLYYSTHLDLEKIVIGTQSALITVPVNVLIVLIFRSVSPRDETHDVRPGIDENSDSYSSDESTSNDVGSYIDDNDTINNGTGDVQSNDSSDSDD